MKFPETRSNGPERAFKRAAGDFEVSLVSRSGIAFHVPRWRSTEIQGQRYFVKVGGALASILVVHAGISGFAPKNNLFNTQLFYARA